MREDLYERAYALAHASRRINGIRFRIARIRAFESTFRKTLALENGHREIAVERPAIPALPETFSRDSREWIGKSRGSSRGGEGEGGGMSQSRLYRASSSGKPLNNASRNAEPAKIARARVLATFPSTS